MKPYRFLPEAQSEFEEQIEEKRFRRTPDPTAIPPAAYPRRVRLRRSPPIIRFHPEPAALDREAECQAVAP